MFVLLAIPIAGGFIVGRVVRSERVATIVAGLLWLVASGWMVVVRATDPWNDINVTFWIGVAAGFVGLVSARLGHRLRRSRAHAQRSSNAL